MTVEIFLYIIITAMTALLIAIFHYYFRKKNQQKVDIILTFLRFISLFSLLLLFLNLKFEKTYLNEIKPKLIVAIDNSKSILYTGNNNAVKSLISKIKSNKQLNSKFSIDYFTFGEDINTLDTLSFSEKQSNLAKPIKEFSKLYKDKNTPVIFITDGNQTYGAAYEYIYTKSPIFPIVVGDTTRYSDLKIEQQNVNKYAYLKNKFPVETFINYYGNTNVTATFSVFKGHNKVFSKKLNFSKKNNSRLIEFFLTADEVGSQYYSSHISFLANEKNKLNNSKDFVVKVIDEQSKVLILSSFLHPDIGMFKKSIETNLQRKVDIKNLSDTFKMQDYQLVILYQPTSLFSEIFKKIDQHNLNYLIITGTKTDWNFLNNAQNYFSKEWINSNQLYQPIFNSRFSTFVLDELDFRNFTPLNDKFGKIDLKNQSNILLYSAVENIDTKEPLLSIFKDNDRKIAALFGENSWRWRMNAFQEAGIFENYDDFLARIVQFLSASKKLDRLTVDCPSINYVDSNINIIAHYFDDNYRFDSNQQLWITVKNKSTNEIHKLPLVSNNNNYAINIENLTSGDYNYTVSVQNNNIKKSGSFKVLSFDIEQQNEYSNFNKLSMLSKKNDGKLYFLNKQIQIFDDLILDKRFKTIQQSEKKHEPLIDWKWLLGLIIVSLSLEWFIRKYNGLI